MAQSQAEKDHILELAEDGRLFCLDLSHNEGQKIAIALAHDSPEVGAELRNRSNNRQYMLVLMPKSHPKPTVVLADSHDVVEQMTKLYEESKHYGNTFAIVCAPTHSKINDLIATLQHGRPSASTEDSGGNQAKDNDTRRRVLTDSTGPYERHKPTRDSNARARTH